ncbi:hypothetical protein F5144DRAFT_518670 [Chaetomium tenue]|uniref:Uncharacterized protein n=1 Tax=Chaetomium tenue TaxID=1854479 RepID=A0ACB7P0U0_9PEZI|nr:hypothetical protein F5144DRAFT_518670 [Chaetomium globosum]
MAPKAQTENNTRPHVVSRHHLGHLPPELFDKIMFEINTVGDLAQFIATACFVYHRFRVQRRAVLFRVLHNELGPVLADARFLFILPCSRSRDAAQHLGWLHAMTEIYHKMLQSGISLHPAATPPLEELNGLCRTLLQINLLADIYVTARLASFDHGGGAKTPATAPLSPSERRRLIRSLYRREMLCHVWAAGGHSRELSLEQIAAISNQSTHEGVALGLFGTLEPWELQQIDHVDVFLTHLCLVLVHGHDLQQQQRAGQKPERLLCRKLTDLLTDLHRLVPLARAHRGVVERAARDQLTPDFAGVYGEEVNECQVPPLQSWWQGSRWGNYPAPARDEWDWDWDEAAAVLYAGEGLDVAPCAWLEALRGRDINQFGERLCQLRQRMWRRLDEMPPQGRAGLLDRWRYAGFCLWDRERVEALKGLGAFGGQLRNGWVLAHYYYELPDGTLVENEKNRRFIFYDFVLQEINKKNPEESGIFEIHIGNMSILQPRPKEKKKTMKPSHTPSASDASQPPVPISITICGDGGCGKSSITLRLVRSQWTSEYDPTIEDSYSVTRRLDGAVYHLSLTDTAGQEEYRGMWASSNLGADAFLLVYDITAPHSLDALDYFNELIDMEAETRLDNAERARRAGLSPTTNLTTNLPNGGAGSGGKTVPPIKMVAGNKCDLAEARRVPAAAGLEWARARGCGFMETSARLEVNVEETFALIVRRVEEARRGAERGGGGGGGGGEGELVANSRGMTKPLTPLPPAGEDDEEGKEKDGRRKLGVRGPKMQGDRVGDGGGRFWKKLRCW